MDDSEEPIGIYVADTDVPVLIQNLVVGAAGRGGKRTAAQEYRLKYKWQSVRRTCLKTGLETGVDSDVELDDDEGAGSSEEEEEQELEEESQRGSESSGSETSGDTDSSQGDGVRRRKVRMRKAKAPLMPIAATNTNTNSKSLNATPSKGTSSLKATPSKTPQTTAVLEQDETNAAEQGFEWTPLKGKAMFGLAGGSRRKKASSVQTPLKQLQQEKGSGSAMGTPSSAARRSLYRQQAVTAANETELSATPLSRFALSRNDDDGDGKDKKKSLATPRTRSTRRRNVIANRMQHLRDDASSEDSDNCLELEEEDDDEQDSDDAELEIVQRRKPDNVEAEDDVWASRESEDEDTQTSKQANIGALGRQGYQAFFQTIPGKNVTSNNTLAQLPKLEHEEYLKILSQLKVKHPAEKSQLMRFHRASFSQWMFEMSYGFNLLFYGYGSKRTLLNEFCDSMLTQHDVLIINGFYPTVKVREALCDVVTDIMRRKAVGTVLELAEQIADFYSKASHGRHLYLMVHNIDGPSMRNDRLQTSLAVLAGAPRTHIIASMDHINAAFLWDSRKASKLNFVYHDLTTFEPYTSETTYENSNSALGGVVNHGGPGTGIRGTLFVLQSLTKKTREIFQVLAKHQLEVHRDTLVDGDREAMMESDPDMNDEEPEEHATSDDHSPKRRRRRPRRAATKKSKTTPSTSKKSANANVRPMDESYGLEHPTFFQKCRANYATSSESAFEAQLVEFKDHGIFVEKRVVSTGARILYIPQCADNLEQILEELE